MTEEAEIVQDPNAFIALDIVKQGRITLGYGTVLHPKAVIRAGTGSIVFGTNNIVEETAVIENLCDGDHVLEIGNDNLFEVGSVCRATKVGDNNNLGVKSVVGPGVEISDGCSIGASCQVLIKGKLPPLTVVYGENNERRTASEKPAGLKNQSEFLRKLLPRHNQPKPAKIS